ncbi:hypothetical protein MPSEU_000759600 [Mayamaea pseudoterrestris]|nr:hypothetical protein MPSEU_000759600 [Mayamaea pseudoterrestris]
MDLTLDSKDLLETLSQGSSARSSQKQSQSLNNNQQQSQSSSTTASNHKRSALANSLLSSNHHHQHAAAASVASSHVDEAFRRLGQRLSLQAHGDQPVTTKRRIRLRPSSKSAFESIATSTGSSSDEATTTTTHDYEQQQPPQRTHKVAKTKYSDHGHHDGGSQQQQSTLPDNHGHGEDGDGQDAPKRHLTNQLTMHLEQLYQKLEQTAPPPIARQALAQQSMATMTTGTSEDLLQYQLAQQLTQYQNARLFSQQQNRHAYGAAATSSQQPHNNNINIGLLSAVMEAQNESTPSIRNPSHALDRSPSGSISTKESLPQQQQNIQQQQQQNIIFQHQQQSTPLRPRGACLTQPSAPTCNDGSDNAEGNLIVYEHDVIVVPRKSLHTLDELNNAAAPLQNVHHAATSAEFHIQSALGQGTFAQVFECLHLETNRLYALKIVKNKPAYTRQATVEIDVFRSLQRHQIKRDYMVSLEYFFMYKNHLCLVFEKLGLNLYEVLKKRQFRGLPLAVVRNILRQAICGIKDLTQNQVVHCDLKPENILLVSDAVAQSVVNAGDSTSSLPHDDAAETSYALGDDGHAAHTYIQSRFYRCPEVLVGLPYDSGIDMWSLGCVAAELFLGLPILPGCHEHDQLGRIQEMIGGLPDWMLDQGSKSTKYYIKYRPNVTPNSERGSPMPTTGVVNNRTPSPWTSSASASPSALPLPQWRLKTQQEYISSLSQSEVSKKGGLEKLEKQPGHRYFRSRKLVDIIALHAQARPNENKDLLMAFIHLLYGVLDPDPWKRMTALQVMQHPFLTGNCSELTTTPETRPDSKEENQANLILGVYWQVPWDPAILRRKLLNVQRQREKQQSARHSAGSRPSSQMGNQTDQRGRSRVNNSSGTSMTETLSQRNTVNSNGRNSPPNQLYSGVNSLSQRLMAAESQKIGHVSASLSDINGVHAGNTSFGVASISAETTPSYQPWKTVTGPQSFGMHDDLRRVSTTGGDFAFALQRPGIVPGASSATPIGSFKYNSGDRSSGMRSQLPDLPPFDQNSYVSTPSRLPQQAPQSIASSLRSLDTSFPHNTIRTDPNSGMNYNQQGHYATLAGQTHGADAQHYQAANAMLQPQQNQYHHLQQHQHSTQLPQFKQLASPQQPLYGVSSAFGQQQPQQQQFQQQQQQQQQQTVYPVSDPTGRVYYVTTSITGQPVILQPVVPNNFPSTQQSHIPGFSQQHIGYQDPNGQQQVVYQNVTIQQQTNQLVHGSGIPTQMQPSLAQTQQYGGLAGQLTIGQPQQQLMYQQQMQSSQYASLPYLTQGQQPHVRQQPNNQTQQHGFY